MIRRDLWKRINMITNRLYEAYLLLEKNENDKEKTEEYINIINTILEVETKLYSQLTVEELEYWMLQLYSITAYDIHNISAATICYFNEKYEQTYKANIIILRKQNRLKIEYNKKKDFNEGFIFDEEEEPYDTYIGTFDIEDKLIYVFDRINEFRRIKSLAWSFININYIKELEQSKKYDKLIRIKYNLLFLDSYTSDEYLNNKKFKIHNGASKELYEYFVEYYTNLLFSSNIDFIEKEKDTDLDSKVDTMEIEIAILELKTVARILGNEALEFVCDELDKNKEARQQVKIANKVIKSLKSTNVKNIVKTPKNKK